MKAWKRISSAMVEDAQKGDPEAIERVMLCFRDIGIHYWNKSVRLREAIECEDFVQHVQMTGWQQLPMFDRTRAGATTWSFMLAKTELKRAIKRDSRKTKKRFPTFGEVPFGARARLEWSEREPADVGFLRALNRREREMCQFFARGLERKHVGDQLGITKERVRQMVIAIREKAVECGVGA